VTAFLATLDAAEESTLSSLLETKAPRNPLTIAHDCWREIERRQVRRQIEAIQARLRTPHLDPETISNCQKQILDLQNRLSDIARPFSPPL
jgi:DNA primase